MLEFLSSPLLLLSDMYELMIIASPNLGEQVSGRVEKFLKEAGTGNVKVERLGKKVLAYPIAKQKEADYLLFNFEADGQGINQVLSKLRLERETILRYLLIRRKVPKVSPIRQAQGKRVSKVQSAEGAPEVIEEKKGRAAKVPKVKSKRLAKTVSKSVKVKGKK